MKLEPMWQCNECKYVGIGDDKILAHSLAHKYADDLIYELFKQGSDVKYPIDYERISQ